MGAYVERGLLGLVAFGLFVAVLWNSAVQLTPEEQLGLMESEYVVPGLPDLLFIPGFLLPFPEHLP